MDIRHGKIGEFAKRVKVGFVGTCEKYYTEDKRYPMIRTTNLTETGIDYSDLKYVTKEFYDKNKKSQLNDGDVLIARFGTSGTACVYHGGEAQCLNAIIVEPNIENAIPEYLAIVINSKSVREQVNRRIVGSTQAILNTKVLSDIDIALPPIEEQEKIVEIFQSLQHICSQRAEEIRILDDLIKARFVELFGNPETNPMGWEQMTLNDVCSSVVRGPFGSALKKEFFVEPGENTYKVYEQKHAIQKSAEIGTYYISEEKYNELKRFECLPGDILMSCSGTMGELYQLPEGCAKGVINQALCKFTLNEKILPVCFLEYMRQTIGNLETKGSGIQNIAAVSYVKAMPINVPTLNVQRQFVSFVEQVDKSKVAVQKALDETQLLFDSLMQEYFG